VKFCVEKLEGSPKVNNLRAALRRGVGASVTERRIVFLTRDPIVQQVGGSTTSALNLVELLARHGVAVTMVTTTAFSRSPRLWFRMVARPAPGVEYFAPGYMRLGNLYLNLFSLRAWGRFAARVAVRVPALSWLRGLVETVFGETLYTEAWDLTPPTEAEREISLRAVERRRATTVIANYAFWGPVLRADRLSGRKRVILMHDLLSARIQQFVEAGIPLDCPLIDEETEMSWLGRADSVLAAQAREAEYVRAHCQAKVLVQPLVLKLQPSSAEPIAQRCLFVGTNILPNSSGLEWMLAEVWPKVLAALPNAKLAVAGTVCDVVPVGTRGVLKLGRVPEMAEEYAKAAVVVAPLLIGSGIKIKLIEALSFGKATVSTSVGVQGMEEWAAHAVEIADDAVGFAAGIVLLMQDEPLRVEREQAALKLIGQQYGFEKSLDADFVDAVM
jgi:glycosyltransferase involved in cell wall biosynthesis